MINFSKIFSLFFWFNPVPHALSLFSVKILSIIFFLCLISALIINLIKKRKKDHLLSKPLQRLSKMFLTLGLVGFVLLFFSYEGVPLLSMRLWYLLWLIGGIIWLFFILRYLIAKVPKLRKELSKKKEFEKYLHR